MTQKRHTHLESPSLDHAARSFAPDFTRVPEPYGDPVSEILAVFNACSTSLHIVDVAGGYGRYAIPLAASGHTVTIIDCHEESLIEAQRRNRQLAKSSGSIRTILADVVRDSAPELRADAALCIGFLHHLTWPAMDLAFSYLGSLLRSGGMAVVELSADKHRRLPSGEPILVGGAPEQNYTQPEARAVLESCFSRTGFRTPEFSLVPLQVRDSDFWYDATMVLATSTKS